MATNISKVYLLNVPLEDDMKNTLYFANSTTQHNYFNSNISRTYNNVSYQSETRTFRCPDQIDTVRQHNYMMWQNSAYSGKWFYAFIKRMTYVSDGYTDVEFEVDPLQTWMFDITVRPSFVEREHTNNDTVGANTYPEGLELGEMVCNGPVTNFGGVGGTGMSDYCCVIEVSQIENRGESATLSYTWDSGSHSETPSLNSIYRGTTPLVVGVVSGAGNTPSPVVRVYDFAGLSESIINVYMLPKALVGEWDGITIKAQRGGDSLSFHCAVPRSKNGVYNLGTSSFNRPNSLNGYVPRNRKLLAHPFNYFTISNNAGTSQPFRYEDFSGGVNFRVEGTFGISGSTKATPLNYRNIDDGENALDYSINGPKYPVCSWKSDSYTNWLTQNSVNMGMQWSREILGAGVDIVGGMARGAIGGATSGSMLGGVGAIPGALIGAGVGAFGGGVSLLNVAKEQFQAKTQANMVGDQVHGNTGAGDFLWAKYRSPFTFTPMSIKAEYARIIDDFMDAFGYQVNRLKVPNTAHRQNWWYTKTINANITGNVPNDEMNKIKQAYNNGLTFWRNPSNFLNYSVSNGIV